MKISKSPSKMVLVFIISFAAGFAYFSGCNNESPIEPFSSYNTSVGVYAENNSSDNTLTLESAKFLFRKIELEHEEEGEGNCEVNLGPVVVNINLFAKVTEFTYSKVIPGVYEEIHFQIHKPSPNENISDPEFFESTSRRYSVIVKGYFNGEYFIYKTDVTISKEIEFENHSVAISANSLVNLTIRINPYMWFVKNSLILNPLDPVNKSFIDDNIRDSFRRAFKDDDCNGEPD